MTLTLQILAALFGMAGSWLLRRPDHRAKWAFALWLVANPAAIAFNAIEGNWPMVAMFSYYLYTSIESTFHWLVKPMLEGKES